MDMRCRTVCVPLLVLLLSFLTAACGKGNDSQWASPTGYVPVNGAESPSVASDAGASGATASKTAGPKTASPKTAASQAPAKRATTSPAARKTTKPKPQLPAGSVPDFLVGSWSGGPGDQSGRYLTITSSGKYERGFSSGGVESSGTVIADENVATFYDRSGGRERAGLTYTDAAGIIVLSVDYAEQGYYSYVPV